MSQQLLNALRAMSIAAVTTVAVGTSLFTFGGRPAFGLGFQESATSQAGRGRLVGRLTIRERSWISQMKPTR